MTHGTFFWSAANEGLLTNTSSIHAGIRTRLSSIEDLTHDKSVGFEIVTTDDLDDMGADGVVRMIKERVGKRPTMLSFDIDTIDPSMAPGSEQASISWRSVRGDADHASFLLSGHT